MTNLKTSENSANSMLSALFVPESKRTERILLHFGLRLTCKFIGMSVNEGMKVKKKSTK